MKSDSSSEILYHGSGLLFDLFDLNHALEGDGKVKFGYGVYVTSQYASAAHYAGANPAWTDHFVYTVEVPAKGLNNYISFTERVIDSILVKATEALQCSIPKKAKENGKEFRKFLANRFAKQLVSQSGGKASDYKLPSEKSASEFLLSIGIDFIEWPYNWKNPEKGSNRAILNDKAVRIIAVDKVKLDEKKQLIPNSQVKIK